MVAKGVWGIRGRRVVGDVLICVGERGGVSPALQVIVADLYYFLHSTFGAAVVRLMLSVVATIVKGLVNAWKTKRGTEDKEFEIPKWPLL